MTVREWRNFVLIPLRVPGRCMRGCLRYLHLERVGREHAQLCAVSKLRLSVWRAVACNSWVGFGVCRTKEHSHCESKEARGCDGSVGCNYQAHHHTPFSLEEVPWRQA